MKIFLAILLMLLTISITMVFIIVSHANSAEAIIIGLIIGMPSGKLLASIMNS